VKRSPLAVLLAAKFVSDVGFALDFVCLGVFAWVATGSAAATAAVSLSLYAGGVLGGHLGQRFGARWDRRRAMIGADLARMAALLGLAVVPDAAQIYWMFPAVLVIGLGRAVFEATLSAATPALSGSFGQQSLNSAISAIKGLALVGGMGLAAVAVPLIGFRGIFLLDAATYTLSAAVLLVLKLKLREDDAVAPAGRSGRVGWATLAAAGLVAIVGIRGLDAFGSASQHIGLLMLGSLRDAANPAGLAGGVWMAWAAGMFAGSMWVRPRLAPAIAARPVSVFGIATAVMSVGFVGIFWFGPLAAVLAAAVVAGAGDALSEVTFKQSLQTLPESRRGGAFGLAQVVLNSGFAGGVLIVGATATPSRIAAIVLLMHGVALVGAVGLAITAWSRTTTVKAAEPALPGSAPALTGSTPALSTATVPGSTAALAAEPE